jgi:hypothetical protein
MLVVQQDANMHQHEYNAHHIDITLNVKTFCCSPAQIRSLFCRKKRKKGEKIGKQCGKKEGVKKKRETQEKKREKKEKKEKKRRKKRVECFIHPYGILKGGLLER